MQAKNQKIVVLGTGGTIAGESSSENEGLSYKAAQRSIDDLLKAVASVANGLPKVLHDVEFESEQVAQLDSKDMDFATWHRLALRCEHWLSQPEVTGLVITHGTDTLEETAYFLSRVVKSTKPIVLTCAMRPANFKDADGPQNLRDALSVTASLQGAGVYLVAAGEIHHSQYMQKVHPTRLNAFDSAEFGPVGVIVHDQIERFVHHDQLPKQIAPIGASEMPEPSQWPWVEILINHVQVSHKHLEALLQVGVQGLVIAGTGNGSVNTGLQEGLAKARANGIPVRLSTRCSQGYVIATETHRFEVQEKLNPVKTRVALMLDMLSNVQGH
jgi:L-asparaginase